MSAIKVISQNSKLSDLFNNLLGMGSLDMQYLANRMNEYDIDSDEFADYINDYIESGYSNSFHLMDLNGILLEFVLSNIKNALYEIDLLYNTNLYHKFDELDISVYSNYIDTSFNMSDETREKAKKLIKKALKKDSDNTLLQSFLEDL